MGDYVIKGQFEAACPPEQVKRWLDDAAGIAGWWSDTVAGDASTVGGEFQVTFPTSPVVFELAVTALGDDVVEWHVAENPPWWKGTTIGFELTATDDGTAILFRHGGFEPDDGIIPVITPAWVRFVDNLVAVAESGTPDPAVVN